MSALMAMFVLASLTPARAAAGCPLLVAAGQACEVPADTHCQIANSAAIKPCASYSLGRGSSLIAKDMIDIGDLIVEDGAKLSVGRANLTGSLHFGVGRDARLEADELSVHGRSVEVPASASLVAKRFKCPGMSLAKNAVCSIGAASVTGSLACAVGSQLTASDVTITGKFVAVDGRAQVQTTRLTVSSSFVSIAEGSAITVEGKLNISARDIVVNGTVTCSPCHLTASQSLTISASGSVHSRNMSGDGGAIHISSASLTADGLLKANANAAAGQANGGFIRVQSGLMKGNGSFQALPNELRRHRNRPGAGGHVQVLYGDMGETMPTVDVQNGGRAGHFDLQQSQHLRVSFESHDSMLDGDHSQASADEASITEGVTTREPKSASWLDTTMTSASTMSAAAHPSVGNQILAQNSTTANEDVKKMTIEKQHAELDVSKPAVGVTAPVIAHVEPLAQVCSASARNGERDHKDGQCYTDAETLNIHAESSLTDYQMAAEDLLKQIQSIVENGFTFAGVKDMLVSLQGSLRVAFANSASEECCTKHAVDQATSALIVVQLCRTGNKNKGSVPLIGWSSSRFSVSGNATYLRAADPETFANLKKLVSVKGRHVFQKLLVEAGTA